MVLRCALRSTAIESRNLDVAIDFYKDTLGMKLASRVKIPETNGELAIMKSEGSEHWLEINWYAGHQYQSGDQLDHIAFQVENLDEALADLKSKGIEPVSHVSEGRNSRWTYILDPNGIWIEIFQKQGKL